MQSAERYLYTHVLALSCKHVKDERLMSWPDIYLMTSHPLVILLLNELSLLGGAFSYIVVYLSLTEFIGIV